MPGELQGEELIYVNGVNGSTGRYIDDPAPVAVAAEAARASERQRSQAEKQAVARRTERGERTYMAKPDVNMRDLLEAGWGVIFPQSVDPRIREALRPLLERRKENAGGLYREYAGADGYPAGQSWTQFSSNPSHRVNLGLADPRQMPYYVLLVGSPEQISYDFQQQVDIERAVGRLDLGDDPAAYERYACSVVAAERAALGPASSRRAVLFGTHNPNDAATEISNAELIGGIAENLAGDPLPGWQVDRILPQDATKERFGRLLGGDEAAPGDGPGRPALLFSATHGAGFNADDRWPPNRPNGFSRQERHQGALVMAAWPGPVGWKGPLDPDKGHYFSADDVPDAARLEGLIAVFFACFSAGTPRLSEFYHLRDELPDEKLQLAERAFTSPLPKRMLSHPGGSALAVVGHVERGWTTAFRTPGVVGEPGRDIKSLLELVRLLMRGYPVGLALEDLASRYTALAEELTRTLYPVLDQNKTFTPEIQRKVARLWTAQNDARNFVLLGDPAVRLVPGGVGDGRRGG